MIHAQDNPEYKIRQYLICKREGNIAIQQLPDNPNYGEIVKLDDGEHLMFNNKTHDAGVIIERVRGNMFDAMLVAESWRMVASVTES